MRKLTYKDFDIQGNKIRAYFDADGKLVFVVDYTNDGIKTNVLLVINPVSNRKWDDILSNDYGIDLETVRPKKDNLYQKLDVDYTGLREYADLINAFENGQDIEDELNDLLSFRQAAVKRIAFDRLDAAQSSAEKARETIEKTNESITDLQVKLKELKAKLASQKKKIGKEPTKQSAAKILRTEAQIDIVNDKIKRAKKRIANAEKRLLAADEEIELVRRITKNDSGTVKVENNTSLPVKQSNNDIAVIKPVEEYDPETEDKESINETENYIVNNSVNNDIDFDNTADVTVDAEEDEEPIKPLFDKDPEILNEEIAFKPINFDVDESMNSDLQDTDSSNNFVNTEELNKNDSINNNINTDNLFFTPPVDKIKDLEDTQKIEQDLNEDEYKPLNVTPVIEENKDSNEKEDNLSVLDSLRAPDVVLPSEKESEFNKNMNNEEKIIENTSETQEVKDVSDVYSDNNVRPVSPVGAPVTDIKNTDRKKNSIFYYALLILLIVLSIFTLWMYQKNSGNNTVPDIAAVNDTEKVTESVMPVDIPEVKVNDVVEIETQPAPVEPVINIVDEPEVLEPVEVETLKENEDTTNEVFIDEGIELQPVTVQVLSDSDAVVEEDPVVFLEPVVDNSGSVDITYSPFITTEQEDNKTQDSVIESQQPITSSVDKPAYNVSQQENMFVAGTGYETDNDFSECSGGALPDVNGCCPGETFSTMSDGTYACCSDDTGECFPPL